MLWWQKKLLSFQSRRWRLVVLVLSEFQIYARSLRNESTIEDHLIKHGWDAANVNFLRGYTRFFKVKWRFRSGELLRWLWSLRVGRRRVIGFQNVLVQSILYMKDGWIFIFFCFFLDSLKLFLIYKLREFFFKALFRVQSLLFLEVLETFLAKVVAWV